jgi:hypothetical protein
MSDSFNNFDKDKGDDERGDLMLRPIDLQVIIVKGVDNAQNTSYSQQLMGSAQQSKMMKYENRTDENRSKVTPRDKFGNSSNGTATDSKGNTSGSFASKERKDRLIDPYRGKVIDIRR